MTALLSSELVEKVQNEECDEDGNEDKEEVRNADCCQKVNVKSDNWFIQLCLRHEIIPAFARIKKKDLPDCLKTTI